MLFNFVTWNHNPIGHRALEDFIAIMAHQIVALGHEVAWQKADAHFIGPHDGVNVLIEGFVGNCAEELERCYKAGARFLCIATEEPTTKGFNHGHFEEFIVRQSGFSSAAPFFEGILYLVPGAATHAWYSQFKRQDGSPVPAAHMRLGWSPTLTGPDPSSKPKFPVGYYGTPTERRMRMLKRLARRLDSEIPISFLLPAEQRNCLMRQCGIIVQIRKFEDVELFSDCRGVMTVGYLRQPLVCEPHGNPGEWANIVHISGTTDEFVDDVVRMSRLPPSIIHRPQFEELRGRLTPQICLGQPLEDIGLIESIKRAA